MNVPVFIFDDLAEARDLINASARKQVWVATENPRRLLSPTSSRSQMPLSSPMLQGSMDVQKLAMAMASRS